MTGRLCLVVFASIFSAFGPSPQWVKPGATEADLQRQLSSATEKTCILGGGASHILLPKMKLPDQETTKRRRGNDEGAMPEKSRLVVTNRVNTLLLL